MVDVPAELTDKVLAERRNQDSVADLLSIHVRHRRRRAPGGAIERDPCGAAERGARAPRSGRRRRLALGRWTTWRWSTGGSRLSIPVRAPHSRCARPTAGITSSSTARSTTTSRCAARCRTAASTSRPAATPKCCCGCSRATAPTRCRACAACSPSPGGTIANARCSWRAIDSASSRSMSPPPPTRWRSPRKSARSPPRDSFERRIDPAGVMAYLSWGTVPPSLTWMEGVESLTPGTWLRRTVDGLAVQRPFADMAAVYARPASGCGEQALKDRVRGAVQDSVAAHLVADVPVGVFLSGGIDSSAILSAAVNAGARGLNTYTVRFDDSSSEHEYARSGRVDVRLDAPRARARLVAHRRRPAADPPASRSADARRGELVLRVGSRGENRNQGRAVGHRRRRAVRGLSIVPPPAAGGPLEAAPSAGCAGRRLGGVRGSAAASDAALAPFHCRQRRRGQCLPRAARLVHAAGSRAVGRSRAARPLGRRGRTAVRRRARDVRRTCRHRRRGRRATRDARLSGLAAAARSGRDVDGAFARSACALRRSRVARRGVARSRSVPRR